MKILLILFVLLFSSSVFADVGDTYFCETKINAKLNILIAVTMWLIDNSIPGARSAELEITFALIMMDFFIVFEIIGLPFYFLTFFSFILLLHTLAGIIATILFFIS